MTNDLDIIPNRIQNKRAIVIRMIVGPQSRRTIVLGTSLNSGIVKGVNNLTIYTS
jgi:hypothetical protein